MLLRQDDCHEFEASQVYIVDHTSEKRDRYKEMKDREGRREERAREERKSGRGGKGVEEKSILCWEGKHEH